MTACATGTYSVSGTQANECPSTCVTPGPGQRVTVPCSASSNAVIDFCSIGTYSVSGSSTSVCTACGAGYTTSNSGATSSASCNVCAVDYFCTSGGGTSCNSCSACPTGSSTNGATGQSTCSVSAGYSCSGSGQSFTCIAATNGGPVALSANAACAAVQGFVTLAASDAANPLGYTVAVAPQSTCSMLSRSSGSLRCAPATLTTTYQGVPVYFVGRSEDIPLALMGSAPDSCGVSPTPSASPSLTATPSPTPTRSYSPSPSPSYVAPYFRPLPPGAGNGLGGQVDCVCNFGSLVVFGGAFTTLGNGTAASRIAAWDGSAWRTLGQGLAYGAYPSQCLTANNQLYVGTSGEGGSAGALWTWSGSAWSTVGSSGFSSNCYLGGLVQWGSKIVAACNFELKAWDGSSWSTVTTVNNNIYALIVYENYVFLGGSFTNPSNNVAKCDSSLTCTGNAGPFVANPTYNYVLAFGIHNGALYAAGYLQVGQNLYVLSSATGTWTQSTPTAGGDVHFLCSFRGLLYVGAWNSNEVYVQDTATNSIVPVGGAGLSGGSFANAAAVNNNMLYIGGQFSSIASSGVSANNAVTWG